jgi:hypothetical protein
MFYDAPRLTPGEEGTWIFFSQLIFLQQNNNNNFSQNGSKGRNVKLVDRIIVKYVRHHKSFLGAFLCFRI